MNVPVEFHESQWPEAVAQQLQDSLRAGVVPGRYLYDSPAQAARWLAYHEAWSPARTEVDVQALYDRAFQAALDQMPAGPLQYVSLGCGGGQKDARWVTVARDRRPTIVLTDTSPALALTAGRAVAEAGATDIRRIVLDLSAWPARTAYGIDDQRPAVWACLGILPNFEHDRLLPYLAGLLAPDDRLVLSANLSPATYALARAQIVPQYDNKPAQAWYDGALLELGFPLSTTERRFTSKPLDESGASWRMHYWARPSEAVALQVYGRTITYAPGTDIQVFQSTRYTADRLATLCQSAGLTQCATETASEEGVYVLRRSS